MLSLNISSVKIINFALCHYGLFILIDVQDSILGIDCNSYFCTDDEHWAISSLGLL